MRQTSGRVGVGPLGATPILSPWDLTREEVACDILSSSTSFDIIIVLIPRGGALPTAYCYVQWRECATGRKRHGSHAQAFHYLLHEHPVGVA